jgi:hypothetical protein
MIDRPTTTNVHSISSNLRATPCAGTERSPADAVSSPIQFQLHTLATCRYSSLGSADGVAAFRLRGRFRSEVFTMATECEICRGQGAGEQVLMTEPLCISDSCQIIFSWNGRRSRNVFMNTCSLRDRPFTLHALPLFPSSKSPVLPPLLSIHVPDEPARPKEDTTTLRKSLDGHIASRVGIHSWTLKSLRHRRWFPPHSKIPAEVHLFLLDFPSYLRNPVRYVSGRVFSTGQDGRRARGNKSLKTSLLHQLRFGIRDMHSRVYFATLFRPILCRPRRFARASPRGPDNLPTRRRKTDCF